MNQLNRLQHGATTIMVSAVLLMLVTMVTVMNANISVMETKTSSNEYRSLQALLSAQAGIDFALSSLSFKDLEPIPETMLTYNKNDTEITTGYYSVSIAEDPNPVYQNQLTITSTGQSADKTATKILTQRLIFSTVLRNDSTAYLNAPLITSGNANIDHTRIDNGKAPARVWSGGVITPKSPGLLAGNGADPTALRKLASKLYEGDPLTNNPMNILFSAQMRANDNQGIKHMSIFHDCQIDACTNPAGLTSTSGFSKIHYVKGGLTLNGVTTGAAIDADAGHPARPVFIIVDLSDGGSLVLNDTTIHGILLVLGDVDINNKSSTINGIFITDGNVIKGNKLTLNFDSDVLDRMSAVGVYTRLPGSWTDS